MYSVNETLQARQSTHGDYHEQAELSQTLQQAMESGRNWSSLSKVQRASLTMILVKVSRILTGDANHADSWHDIAGYATLAENDLSIYPSAEK